MECEYEGQMLPVTILTDFIQCPPVRSYNIIGENGRIFLDLINSNISLSMRGSEVTEFFEYKYINRNQLFIDELKYFLEIVSGNIEPIVNIETGLVSLRMALAAHKSLKTGEPVKLK
jgi:predicted dehydrogenase